MTIAPTRIVRTEADRARLLDDMRAMPIDKPLRVEIKRHRERRTLSQNSTHWWRLNWLADALALETGHTPDELHELFKMEFCPVKRIDVLGHSVAVRSTTKLSTAEMADMMTRIEAWAAQEWGLELPEPIPARVREYA